MAETKTREDQELLADGWTRQFNTDEPRLSEAVEMYQQMGLEVHLEPVIVDPDSETCQRQRGNSIPPSPSRSESLS